MYAYAFLSLYPFKNNKESMSGGGEWVGVEQSCNEHILETQHHMASDHHGYPPLNMHVNMKEERTKEQD